MRRLIAACLFLALPAMAVADPLTDAGRYTPSAFAKAGQNGKKAVLLHVVSRFCGICEAQKTALTEATQYMLGVERHAVVMDVPIETWGNSSFMDDIGVSKSGVFVLMRGDEALGRVETADVAEITALLTPLVPVPVGTVDPSLVDPSTGLLLP